MSDTSPFSWTIKSYDLLGNETGDFSKAHSRWWNPGPINSAATMGLTLDVDDPRIALLENPLGCVLKMWRSVVDPKYGVDRVPDPAKPDFCGRVSSRNKSGRSIAYTASDPLWGVQFHFHKFHHRLHDPLQATDGQVVEGATLHTIPATISGLIWKCIDMVQNAFGYTTHAGDVGLRFDPAIGTGNDTGQLGYWVMLGIGGLRVWIPGVYSVPVNSWTWDDHVVFLLGQDNAPDLHIKYVHEAGEAILAWFWMDWPGRGTDRSGSVKIAFGTAPHNCEQGFDYDESYVPKQWGNFVRALGTGPTDTALSREMALDEVAPDDPLAIQQVGAFMFQEQYNNVVSALSLDAKMRQDLLRQSARPIAYTVNPSSTKPPYYDVDYSLGDVCLFESVDGLDHRGPDQLRVMDARIDLSDNDYETLQLTVATDVLGKVSTSSLQAAILAFTGQGS